MHQLGSTLRIIRPAPHIIGFYDGRIDGVRAHSASENWLDDGAFALGICSYAIVDGNDALVYDTHMSLAHAGLIRHTLEAEGVTSIRVVLSHWHTDHVAGNAVFQDCPIIANRLTASAMIDNRAELEEGDPPIKPLIMPTQLFEGTLDLMVGTLPVSLRQADIHSEDGTVLFLPETRLLLAGDTVEDPITYVSEPSRLRAHLADLDRMAGWPITRILPSHGDREILESGGYGPALIEATRLYVEKLLRAGTDPALVDFDMRRFAADAFATGGIRYFAAYETVHRRNLEAATGAV
jgi:glyoxylase-like metal-dependent hydrolase (beta-lactamase superfamily II)